ncbi:hypothetical protein AURDEDRAFT_176477 [Auricularia subglabra TFB-10046 SS5]|uniref:Uncharacterized protein n=1 Tax=Auricularia subglabra (strain TFB-10046 / SS5) TaxID=717982 RepID=J0WRC6_AURST|nr:hypothetical protein AURDEDRAFT_176477 [Auricularia subglabra TFB-10046 SS5]
MDTGASVRRSPRTPAPKSTSTRRPVRKQLAGEVNANPSVRRSPRKHALSQVRQLDS